MIRSSPATGGVARVVVVVATVWFAFTAAWGMFGIPGGGHLGAGSAATTMAAEQMVRWKILYPAWSWYAGVAPAKAAYVCHHPFGTFYWSALFIWVFGHRDFVVHLPTVLLSTAIPPLLYGIAKERWGAHIGAVAAASYVVVPLAVGYSSYTNTETICIFGALLFFWGHSRHMTTGKGRYLAVSLIGVCCTCMGEWEGYLFVAPTLAWALLRAFVLPARLTPRLRIVPYARWWALSVAVMVLALVLQVGLYFRADHVADWLSAGELRGSGTDAKLRDVLKARSHWLAFSFTPLAIFLGKVAAPVSLLRWIATRRDEETYALGLLFGAGVHYTAFKQGADVHIFWAHYFAPYFALALAQLAAAISAPVGWVARGLSASRGATIGATTGLVIGLFPVVAMAHDGVLSLWVWRRTGGRYDDNGALIRSHIDMLSVLEQVVLPKTLRDGRFDVHPSAAFGWEHLWKTQSNPTTVDMPAVGDAGVETHPFWLARGSGLSSQDAKKAVSVAHVRIYGDTWIVDQREPPAPLDAYSLNEREPLFFEWLAYGGTEPVRTVGATPDPWLTWEWRKHLGQPAELPMGDPVTLEEMRIAHNIAVDRGDAVPAQRWRERLEREIDRSREARFTGGTHLLGVRLTGGVQPRIEAWFECAQAPAGDASFNVRSTIEARAPLSLIPPDDVDREMAWPPSLPTKLWRAGFLYSTQTVLNHRIGRERYWGYWASRDGVPAPLRLDGEAQTTLVVLP